MDQILTWEASSSSAIQAIFRVLWNPKIRNQFHKILKGLSILCRDSITVHQTLGICSRCRGSWEFCDDDDDDDDDDGLLNDSAFFYMVN